MAKTKTTDEAPAKTATQRLHELESKQNAIEHEIRNLEFELAAPPAAKESPTEAAALHLLGRGPAPEPGTSRSALKERLKGLRDELAVVNRAKDLLEREVQVERAAHRRAVNAAHRDAAIERAKRVQAAVAELEVVAMEQEEAWRAIRAEGADVDGAQSLHLDPLLTAVRPVFKGLLEKLFSLTGDRQTGKRPQREHERLGHERFVAGVKRDEALRAAREKAEAAERAARKAQRQQQFVEAKNKQRAAAGYAPL